MAVQQNSLAKRQEKQTFSTYLTADAVKNKINQMIGGKDGQRFITSVISAVSTNPALGECDYSTILSAAMLGEALKLSPSPQLGQFYMVPFDDNKLGRKVATFVLGYKGYIQLAIRSGYYKKINVLSIKEGELIKFDPLNEEIEVNLITDDTAREAAATIGYYTMFEYHNGFRKAMYWSVKKMEAHALQFSKGYASDKRNGKAYTFWSKDFDGMAYKTMLRQLISKWGIMSIELQQAYEKDDSLLHEDGSFDYVDNQADEPINIPSVQTEDITVEAPDENAKQSFFEN